ncbi:MAG: HEAT repeat domain-containing protein [Candidatus Woesebacteria bacterium]
MNSSIDWDSETEKFFHNESAGSTRDALELLTNLIDEQSWINAVESAISWSKGGKIAECLLVYLHAWPAMQYCYNCYKNDTDYEHKVGAVIILRRIGDRRTIPWAEELLNDPDEQMQSLGIEMVDQLIFKSEASFGEPHIRILVGKALRSSNKFIQNKAKRIIRESKDNKKSSHYSNKLLKRSGKLYWKWDEDLGVLMKRSSSKKKKHF